MQDRRREPEVGFPLGTHGITTARRRGTQSSRRVWITDKFCLSLQTKYQFRHDESATGRATERRRTNDNNILLSLIT